MRLMNTKLRRKLAYRGILCSLDIWRFAISEDLAVYTAKKQR